MGKRLYPNSAYFEVNSMQLLSKHVWAAWLWFIGQFTFRWSSCLRLVESLSIAPVYVAVGRMLAMFDYKVM